MVPTRLCISKILSKVSIKAIETKVPSSLLVSQPKDLLFDEERSLQDPSLCLVICASKTLQEAFSFSLDNIFLVSVENQVLFLFATMPGCILELLKWIIYIFQIPQLTHSENLSASRVNTIDSWRPWIMSNLLVIYYLVVQSLEGFTFFPHLF